MGYGYVTVGWRSHDERYSATIGICFTRRLFDVNNFAGSPALVEECAPLSAVLDIICIVIAIVIPSDNRGGDDDECGLLVCVSAWM